MMLTRPFALKCWMIVVPVLVCTLEAEAQGSIPLYSKVRIHFDGRADAMRQLSGLGLPVDHGTLERDAFTTDLSEREIQIARDHGFTCEVLIEDVSAYYRERNAAGPPPEQRADGWLCDGPRTFARRTFPGERDGLTSHRCIGK